MSLLPTTILVKVCRDTPLPFFFFFFTLTREERGNVLKIVTRTVANVIIFEKKYLQELFSHSLLWLL